MYDIAQTPPQIVDKIGPSFVLVAIAPSKEIFFFSCELRHRSFAQFLKYTPKGITMKTTHAYKQLNLAGKALVISCLTAVLGLAGCEQEGTAEKAGKKSIVRPKMPSKRLSKLLKKQKQK